MSLRDQLLKAGLVNKKKVRQANRQLKKKRRAEQGSRSSKKARQRAEEQAAEAAKAQRAERVRAERAKAHARKEQEARRRAIQTWLRTHRVPMRAGNQLFFHLAANRKKLVRCMFPESVVMELRRGRLAVAWDGPSSRDPDYLLLPDRTAARIAELAPQRLLFWNAQPPPEDDPAEQPYDMGEIQAARERVPDRWAGLR